MTNSTKNGLFGVGNLSSFKTKNKDVVVNLMSAFMNSLDEREAAGLPRDPSASWKEASLVLHADDHISEEEKEEKVEKKEKKKEVSFEKEEEKSRKERRKQKEEEERKKIEKMEEDRKKRDEAQKKKNRENRSKKPSRQ